MNELMQQLLKVEALAGSGKLARLLHNPLRYIQTQAFAKMLYPITRKASLKTVETFFGNKMQVLLPAAADIYLTGGKTHSSEIRLARYMIRSIQPGDVFVDVGAHFGYFTLLAARLAGNEGKVYAFEPAKHTFGVLKENVSPSANIVPLHNAVSDEEETVSFYEFPVLYSEYNTMSVEQFQHEAWIKSYKPEKTSVRAVTLDLFAETILKAPGFIKIDAEGAEDKVITGSAGLLKKYSPVVIMEYLPASRSNAPHVKAEALLNAYGYRPHIINAAGNTEPIESVAAYFEASEVDSENIVFKKDNK